MKKITKNIAVENARIVFRNFSGKETKYNREGNMNFSIIFDKDMGEELLSDGWNVRILQPREDGDEPAYALGVSVSYANIPPRIYLISGRRKTKLDEDSISCLDYAEIINADVVIRPYNWEVSGKTGVKAYVSELYVEVQEDRFSSKYDFDEEI